MGDKELKIEKINYSEDELQEIDRITNVISGGDTFNDIVTSPPLDDSQDEDFDIPDLDDMDDISSEVYIGEPDDLDLPVGDLNSITSDTFPDDEQTDDITDDLSDMMPLSGDEAVEDIESMLPEDVTEVDIPEISQENLDDIDEEVEDISDLIQEIEEVPEILETEVEPDMLADVEENLVEDLEIPDVFDEDFTDEVSEDITPGPGGEEKKLEERNALDQLDDLTEGEPESVDIQELAEDTFVGEDINIPDAGRDEAYDIPEMDEIDELPGDMGDDFPETMDDTVSLDKDVDMDIPDLSDLTLEDIGEIPEASDSDIPDIELEDLAPVDEDSSELGMSDSDFMPPDLEDVGDIGTSVDEGTADDFGEIEPLDEVEVQIEDIPDIQVTEISTEDEPMTIEPLEDDEEEDVPVSGPVDGGSLQLSENELNKLKKAIILFNPAVIKEIKDTVINDRLPVDELQKLIDMIISGRPEDNIHRFLEKKLKRKIELVDEATVGGRRIITSRQEYTREGRDRQKKLLKLTKIFGGAALIAFTITILSYQYLYKPYMAKKTINRGVELILSAGDYQKKPKDYVKAEELLKYVDENYAKDYLYGYNSFGRAYFDKEEYNRSLQKLDRAYAIDSTYIKTLNNLGYFYSRVPAPFYRTVRGDVEKKYFREKKLSDDEKSQLNLAISFYQRALLINKKNIPALLGIGDAYFHQGQFLKAKKYYEDILRVDKNSIVGYSGLMNLYIERDSFPQVATLLADIRDKNMLHEMPSALLGKLAGYFLGKTRSDEVNVRIDYGVRSPRIKDLDDNTYPAVRTVLQALNKRDSSYPPLQIYYALLSRKQNNLLIMKRHLEKAVELSPGYFAALHLLGEYFYNTKEPVQAYKLLNEAIKSYGNQPGFTRDDFYREIVHIGETYSVLGNIFYYFFDKIRFKFGDLEDRMIDDDLEKMGNYNIARNKYEDAIREGYKSSELNYNLGRIYYLNKLYRKALDQWLHLYEDFVKSPELMYALGNAFYHLGNYEASKGEYLKLISVSDYDAEKIKFVEVSRNDHFKLFNTLASVYNNLGAIYQRQDDEGKSSISYWKAIDYAKRLQVENEFARVNLARSYKPGRKAEPILDENIPYSIDYYREEMRR